MQSLVNGLAQGCVLAISALGFSFVSATIKGLHLAHGAVLMAAGLVAAIVASVIPFGSVTITSAILASVFIGLAIELLVYWPLAKRQASPTAILLASLGVYLATAGLLAAVFGQQFVYAPDHKLSSLKIGSAVVSRMQQLEMIVCAAVCVILIALLKSSTFGQLLRAQADDPELVDVLVGRTRFVRLMAALIGSILAGIAGILVGLDVGMDANYGLVASIGAAVATVLAGAGLSVRPALAALGIGLLQAQVASLMPEKWSVSVTYIVLFIFLFFRSALVRDSFAGRR